ncbi:hypothetical protein ACFP67_13985 [Mammaliicoccus sciuri]|uniref:hypothetical protein n=1 Tax=Mammaliicoccus sciuri TaxID=1296 RepID=UPI000CD01DA8|nr:hypothetical protein [Mammaliicoccus sciuri]PNZ30021.1 hypothetical protein CD114_01325 [Mammaliicoccus sciuri]
MPMSEQEALKICELIKNTYNIEFTEEKMSIWIGFLSNEADYKPSLRAATQYIKNGNTYPPNIAHLLHKEPKIENTETQVVREEVKEHLWRMENDSAYREENRRLKMQYKEKMKEINQRLAEHKKDVENHE